jgi:pyruvate formate lyase activating enzyme
MRLHVATLQDVLSARTHEAAPELVETLPGGRLRCHACGHQCPISDGAVGVCKVRFNEGGRLHVPWAMSAACSAIPSRRSLFHVYPGALAYSIGMLGCDLHCSYCQNWVTSQALRDPMRARHHATPHLSRWSRTRFGKAQSSSSPHNEPLITVEWAVANFP